MLELDITELHRKSIREVLYVWPEVLATGSVFEARSESLVDKDVLLGRNTLRPLREIKIDVVPPGETLRSLCVDIQRLMGVMM